MESRDQILFEREYSATIWRAGLENFCTRRIQPLWPEISQWAKRRLTGLSFKQYVNLFWAASVYWLWQERNRRIHRSEASTLGIILQRIRLDVVHKCMALEGIDRNPVLLTMRFVPIGALQLIGCKCGKEKIICLVEGIPHYPHLYSYQYNQAHFLPSKARESSRKPVTSLHSYSELSKDISQTDS